MDVSLELLTDEVILDYSRSNGIDRVLYDHRDFNLRYNRIEPISGGVYDTDVFGSPISDRCVCGHVRQPSPEPCPNCGARVFTREEAMRRFARIELPFYYLNNLRFNIFKELFDDIFSDCTIKLNFFSDDFKRLNYGANRGGKRLGIKAFDSCQFNYIPSKKELVVSEFITDESKCSYEGILKILEKYFPERVTEYKKLINRYVLVLPITMRPFQIEIKGKNKEQVSHPLSIWYSIIIRLCCVLDKKSNDLNYEEVMSRFSNPGERVRYTALLRALLNAGKKESTELLNTSKENLARTLYAVRTKNSARCPIVPSTELPIDKIGIPTSVAYEMLREEFIGYLQEKLNFTYKEARKVTKLEALNPETQKLFREYAEQRYVIVNRQPTLHEYGMFCCKIELVDDVYSIKFPIGLCSPLNADFDGDTVTIQLVPENVAEDTYNKMSPRYVNVYKKNNLPIFPLNLETLNGLAVASEFTPTDPSELKEPRYYYTDYVELLRDVEVDRKIKIGTPIVFTGKIGNEEYKNKITTYGKLRISKILDADIDKINVLKDQYSRIDSKAATKLSSFLNKDDRGVEKRNELQKFALRAVTLAGVVTFDFKTLFADTDTDLYKEICEIADSKELTDNQKIVMLTKRYEKYEKEIEGKFSDDLKSELSRAGKIKITSISALNMPQLIISGVDEKPVITRGSLLSGYGEKDMIYHSIENRSLQSIKVSGTPSSGYLNRQISFVVNHYIYKEGEDLENPGLLIPRYKAGGRTAPDGKVYQNREIAKPTEDDLVPVRSIVTKCKGDLNAITPDLLEKGKFDFTEGAAIGVSFGTSLMEGTTQSALGLKHGGHERKLDQTGYLQAPEDCTLREDGKWMYLKTKKGELKYPKPENLITLNKDTFSKGEDVCCAYNTTTPIYDLNCLINLLRARGNVGKRYYEKENVLTSDCYAFNDGTIHYEEDKKGNVVIKIDNVEYDYNPACMYYFPDGTKVKKYDRICNGVVRMDHVTSYFPNDINSVYMIFRKQFYTVSDKGFLKSGITDLHATQEELIETIFAGLTHVEYDEKTAAIESIDYLGTQSSVLNKDSFYTTLSYGFAEKAVNKALKGNANINDDVMSEVILGLLINDKIDKE